MSEEESLGQRLIREHEERIRRRREPYPESCSTRLDGSVLHYCHPTMVFYHLIRLGFLKNMHIAVMNR